ncbi:hypothetical protein [Micromonospora fulviviridis]|uniref:Uncharacterized protein n=1 Tax=Micromonospora fulviviridis TaxID=47860 RepID=A0ABV2VWH2_9ACTN
MQLVDVAADQAYADHARTAAVTSAQPVSFVVSQGGSGAMGRFRLIVYGRPSTTEPGPTR